MLLGMYAATLLAAEIAPTDPDGTTPLHWAVRHDDIATADTLIKAGADAKAVNRYGVTAMNLAAVNGSSAMIRKLLDAGADPAMGLRQAARALRRRAATDGLR